MSAELEKAKSNLEKAEKRQEIMKKTNAIIRTGKDVTAKLVEAGLSEDVALKVQQPDFAGRIGFPSYELTNNNATIKRLKDRVNQLESKETASTAGEERYMFEGGSVEVNYADDRVQILYNAIPTVEQRTQLKSNGWKWSPKNTAWQRKITPQAISNAKYLTGATGAAPVQEQTGPIDTDELLKKRKFSYVTINLYNALPLEYTGNKTFEIVYFDVISANIVEAVRAYFKENIPEIAPEKIKVSVYTKTYVKESQRLVDQNRFLPNDAPAKIVLGPGLQQIKDLLSKKTEPLPPQETEQERLRRVAKEREIENERIANEKIDLSALTEGEVFLQATSKGGKYEAKLIYRAPEFYDIVATGMGGGGKLSQVMNTIRYWKEEYPVVLIDKFDLLGTGSKTKADSEQFLHGKAENKKYSSQLELIIAFEADSNEDRELSDQYNDLYQDILNLFNSGVVSAKRYFIEQGAQPFIESIGSATNKDQYRKAITKFTYRCKEIMTSYIDQADKDARQLIGDGLFFVLQKKYGTPKSESELENEDFAAKEPEKKEIVKKTYAVTRRGHEREMWKEAEDKQDAIYLIRKSLHGTWGKWFPESHFTARLVPDKDVEARELELENERNEEFDNEVMESLDPQDSWVGNIIKERAVKKQINDQVTGPESEKEVAVNRIFEKYKTVTRYEDLKHSLETVSQAWKDTNKAKFKELQDEFNSLALKLNKKTIEQEPEHVLRFPELEARHPLNILDLQSSQYKQALEEHNSKKFIKEHIIIGKVPDHHAQPKSDSDSKVLDRYPKLSKSEVVNVYNQVEAILGKEEYTTEDKYILEKYEGLGSQTSTGIIDKGLLHQFYTPYIIAKKMWELGFIYGVPKENPIVIEPSMGTGRFFKYAPAGSTCIGFDPDKKNVEIAKILYPDITVHQQEFETAFLEAPRYNRMAKKSWLPEADLCIGNPPYGDYMGYYKSYMPSAFKRFEFLFIYLGLKTLKPGGLLVFIVSQNFMNNGAMYNGMKAKILEIGEFVDSIRLPNGIFSSTDVGTDIVIFRKK